VRENARALAGAFERTDDMQQVLTADKLVAHSRLPLAWHDQRTALGFA
jgi:hypothetical protein